jgi:hypothetical protein
MKICRDYVDSKMLSTMPMKDVFSSYATSLSKDYLHANKSVIKGERAKSMNCSPLFQFCFYVCCFKM